MANSLLHVNTVQSWSNRKICNSSHKDNSSFNSKINIIINSNNGIIIITMEPLTPHSLIAIMVL
jgi:hypothetical protein